MTWAINAGGTVKPEVYQFLADVGKGSVNATPSTSVPTIGTVGPYAPDLLPLMQQMAWAVGTDDRFQSVKVFLNTVAWYLNQIDAKFFTGPYQRPTLAMPPALQYLVLENEISSLFQVAYWLINMGASGNVQAWNFLLALSTRLVNRVPATTAKGPYQYPRLF
jgi:hypothetical protein